MRGGGLCDSLYSLITRRGMSAACFRFTVWASLSAFTIDIESQGTHLRNYPWFLASHRASQLQTRLMDVFVIARQHVPSAAWNACGRGGGDHASAHQPRIRSWMSRFHHPLATRLLGQIGA